jgi:cellulose synthase/poly-beta-1,6-N-acetylglucosamine synthase-like glycosyltransferase
MTRLQAFSLDAHFNIEQQGRNAGGLFINFNGTAGVWRKSCILDAGNWQSDTLTEDLDLSYRAQLKGWKFKYLGEVGTPAELPVTMDALKTQQFRWSKGAAECVRKNLPSVLISRKLSPLTKIHAFFHLTNSTVFTCILLTALFSIPFLFIREYYQINPTIYFYAFFSLLNLVPLGLFYWVSESARRDVSAGTFFRRLFLGLSFSMGLSLQNSVAVWQGYLGKKIPFIRTPKYDIRSRRDSWRAKKYLVGGIRPLGVLEGVLAVYFLVGIYLDVYFQTYVLLPYHIMLATGFGTVFAYSMYHAKATPELVR